MEKENELSCPISLDRHVKTPTINPSELNIYKLIREKEKRRDELLNIIFWKRIHSKIETLFSNRKQSKLN